MLSNHVNIPFFPPLLIRIEISPHLTLTEVALLLCEEMHRNYRYIYILNLQQCQIFFLKILTQVNYMQISLIASP